MALEHCLLLGESLINMPPAFAVVTTRSARGWSKDKCFACEAGHTSEHQEKNRDIWGRTPLSKHVHCASSCAIPSLRTDPLPERQGGGCAPSSRWRGR